MNILQDVLTKKFHKEKHIAKALKKQRLAPKKRENEEKIFKAFVPYVRGTTDKIAKILKRHNIETIFTTYRKVKDLSPAST